MGGLDFTGDWDRMIKNLGNVGNVLQDSMGDALETGAEHFRGAIIKGIRDQKWPHPPLKESTKEKKDKAGQSDKILIAEGDYLSSFAVEKVAWDEVHVGTNHPQGRALEFGYEPRNLPARAHVGPAIDEETEEYLDILQKGMGHMFENLFR